MSGTNPQEPPTTLTVATDPAAESDGDTPSPEGPHRRVSSRDGTARRRGVSAQGPSRRRRYSSDIERAFYYDDWPEDQYERDWRYDSRHPEYYDRRYLRPRPPLSHHNHQTFHERNNPRYYVEEPRTAGGPSKSPSYRIRDEEMGVGPDHMRSQDGSIAGVDKVFDWSNLTREEKAQVMRLPWLQWMNSDFKNNFVASLGEFVGTTMFLFFAFAGTEVANIQSAANNSGSSNDSNTTTGGATGFNVGVLLYISLSFGFSLMVNVWIFFRISGGLFNPAVTFAMVLVRAITPTRALCLFVAQMCGGLAASVMVRFLFPENFNVRTTLSGGASLVQGVFIEAILTAELVFTIFMLAKEKHRATFIAPVGIGLALFIAELVGVQFTGGSLNPARSFGPCVITTTFDAEHWIYWAGPLIGSLIAVVFYKFIKILEYEMANPGADGVDPTNDPARKVEKKTEPRTT